MNSMNGQKILILGSNGFVGLNMKKVLEIQNFDLSNIIFHNGKEEVDLHNQLELSKYFTKHKPDIVINLTAFVGGISYGYEYPAKILHDNSRMILNLFEVSRENNVSKVINPISNCAYPGNLSFYQEDKFWDGKPHESVFNYALSRRLIVAMGDAYYKQYNLNTSNVVLSNMYGKHDHFDEKRSHALGAILNKVYNAKIKNLKKVNIWGTGKPIREWLYVDDGVNALLKSISLDDGHHFFNVGVNKGISIKELSEKIARIVEWDGSFEYDLSKPDGAIEKRVDGQKSLEKLSWEPQISLDEGLDKTIRWYIEQKSTV